MERERETERALKLTHGRFLVARPPALLRSHVPRAIVAASRN